MLDQIPIYFISPEVWDPFIPGHVGAAHFARQKAIAIRAKRRKLRTDEVLTKRLRASGALI